MRQRYNRISQKELRSIRKKIGENLRNQRLKRKMTLRYMAEEIRINFDIIDQFEMGKRNIQLEDINIFANFFHVSIDTLLR